MVCNVSHHCYITSKGNNPMKEPKPAYLTKGMYDAEILAFYDQCFLVKCIAGDGLEFEAQVMAGVVDFYEKIPYK